MTDDELLGLITTKSGQFSTKSFNNLDDTTKKILYDRFPDADNNIKEILYRLRNHVEKRPTCVICGGRVKFNNNAFTQTCLRKECLSANNLRTVKLSFLKKYGNENPWADENLKNERYEKSKATVLRKYGVENVSKLQSIKDQKVKKSLDRYGTKCTLLNEEVHKKTEITLKEKYGVEIGQNIFASEYGKTKVKSSLKDHYGVEVAMHSKEIREKNKKYFLEKYGVANPYQIKEVIDKIQEKRKISLKKNNTFNKSKPEDEIKELLWQKFPDMDPQHNEKRYPFNCDFYIPSLDLFIKYNGTWTHGTHPYDPNNKTDIDMVERWKSKNSTEHPWYGSAINNWTIRDPHKREIAKKNHLNYVELWTLEEAKKFIEKL